MLASRCGSGCIIPDRMSKRSPRSDLSDQILVDHDLHDGAARQADVLALDVRRHAHVLRRRTGLLEQHPSGVAADFFEVAATASPIDCKCVRRWQYSASIARVLAGTVAIRLSRPCELAR